MPSSQNSELLRKILSRIHELDGPDREVDLAIDTAVYGVEWRRFRDDSQSLLGFDRSGKLIRQGVASCAAVTANLDAAVHMLTYALPGWSWQVHTGSQQSGGFCAAVWRAWGSGAYIRYSAEAQASPALAVVHAAMNALLNDPAAADAW
jgi:hypothetical protein